MVRRGLPVAAFPRQARFVDVDVVGRLTCEWSADEFDSPQPPSGRGRKYCRPAHRQRAYEARRVLREAQSELPRLRDLLCRARAENRYLLEELRRLGWRSPFDPR